MRENLKIIEEKLIELEVEKKKLLETKYVYNAYCVTDEIINNFNFEKVLKVLSFLGYNTNISELKTMARELFNRTIQYEYMSANTDWLKVERIKIDENTFTYTLSLNLYIVRQISQK